MSTKQRFVVRLTREQQQALGLWPRAVSNVELRWCHATTPMPPASITKNGDAARLTAEAHGWYRFGAKR
jgi:hypothetical protein